MNLVGEGVNTGLLSRESGVARMSVVEGDGLKEVLVQVRRLPAAVTRQRPDLLARLVELEAQLAERKRSGPQRDEWLARFEERCDRIEVLLIANLLLLMANLLLAKALPDAICEKLGVKAPGS
jgi:hypothetical protein